MSIKNSLEFVSNVVECEVEMAEDAGEFMYATDLNIAMNSIKKFIEKRQELSKE